MCALVTGVQTCALPISAAIAPLVDLAGRNRGPARRLRRCPALGHAEGGVGRRGERPPARDRHAGAGSTAQIAGSARYRSSLPRCAALSSSSVQRHWPRQTTPCPVPTSRRSEEHTSELQSLMRISYDVFCLNKNNNNNRKR